MTERSETQRRATDAISSTPPNRPCLGNGCGDFGFIEDLSTLIAIKVLVDDGDSEERPAEAPHPQPVE